VAGAALRRYREAAVVRDDIECPVPFAAGPGDPPSAHGTLIVAKAPAHPDVPYELLAYALKEPAFPARAAPTSSSATSTSTPTGRSASTSAPPP
jgi:hypothetical protein